MDRFESLGTQELKTHNGFLHGMVEVLRDKQTGVMYMYRSGCGGAGLTVLVDKDGKPMTTFKVSI